MAHIQWKERYNINYKEVDAQHRRLLDILNDLLDLVQCKRPAEESSVIFHRLCAYALDHFTLEESYLAGSGYPGLAHQQEEHGFFIRRVLEFNERYDPADPAFLQETFEFLKTWYLVHILRSDMEYVPWLKRFRREARIRAVLVDFEGLLAAADPGAFIAALASATSGEAAALERRLLGDSLLDDYQAGAIDQATFQEELSLPGEPLLAEAFSRMYTPLGGLSELLQSLKPRCKLGLVANSHPWHAERIVAACPVIGLFDAVVLSHQAKALVPDHRILDEALDQLGVMSEECLFLTNRAAHREAAERQCFQTLPGPEPAEVLKLLARRGV